MSANSEQKPLVHSEFLNRVSSLPSVVSAVQLGNSQYQRLKSSNGFVGGAINMAEKSAAFAMEKTVPLLPLQAMSRPIGFVDSLACKGLDKMEETLPIVKNPPEQIYSGVKDYSNAKLQVVLSALSVPGERAMMYRDQLYEAIEAALKVTDGILDKHIAAIGEENVARKMDKLEFRQHLDEIAQKVRICLSHHTGNSIASVKQFALSPRQHLVATLQHVREIKNDLQSGKNLQEVLMKLQITWLNSLVSGDTANESVARQVLSMFNSALTQASAVVQNNIPISNITRYIPETLNPEKISALTTYVLEQFHCYSIRLQGLLQQLPSAPLSWGSGLLSGNKKPLEPSHNRTGSTDTNCSEESSALDTSDSS